MNDARNFIFRVSAIVVAVLAIFLSLSKIASASTGQLKDTWPAATSEPVALYITICLWSTERTATCRDYRSRRERRDRRSRALKPVGMGRKKPYANGVRKQVQYSASPPWPTMASGSKDSVAACS
jgi:hypothetical protein